MFVVQAVIGVGVVCAGIAAMMHEVSARTVVAEYEENRSRSRPEGEKHNFVVMLPHMLSHESMEASTCETSCPTAPLRLSTSAAHFLCCSVPKEQRVMSER
mmetsp:Transcript_39919/g.62263  ORF Transcript_39919/g.62263 Transcript_39919/m.62263 type:complete len:101 (+) Transcript_39919:250-552(+)